MSPNSTKIVRLIETTARIALDVGPFTDEEQAALDKHGIDSTRMVVAIGMFATALELEHERTTGTINWDESGHDWQLACALTATGIHGTLVQGALPTKDDVIACARLTITASKETT